MEFPGKIPVKTLTFLQAGQTGASAPETPNKKKAWSRNIRSVGTYRRSDREMKVGLEEPTGAILNPGEKVSYPGGVDSDKPAPQKPVGAGCWVAALEV